VSTPAAADTPLTTRGSLTAAELIEAAIADDPEGHDPFEAFSLATGAAAADPHAHWRALQHGHGVYPGRASPAGEPSMSDFMYGQREVYSVLRFEEASQVFRDGHTFSSSVLGESVGLVWGRTMIQMDEPEHGRYRRLIQQAFTRHEMERWEHDIARPLLRRYLDALRPHGRAELVRELLLAYPATVMARAMGLPEDDLPRFLRLTVEMTNIAFEPQRALGASAALAEYLLGQVEQRRTHPGREDLLTGLITATLAAEDHASGAAEHLTDEEIVSFVRLLLIAGAETTARSSATMLLLLLRHPDQFAAVRADHDLIPAVVEETLRLEPPLNVSTRTTTRPCVVGGVELPEDAAVQVIIGAVNRDPRRWEHPDSFDLGRQLKGHLAFISGAHICLGMHLARMEMRVILEEVLDRLPGLALDPEPDEVLIRGKELRSPPTLPVVYDRGVP
jgi:cytochrome P450